MRHFREDYNRIQDPAGLIPAEEPVFILRGQDLCAPAAVRAWANELTRRGGDVELIAAGRLCAVRMEEWQREVKGKVPDSAPVPAEEPPAVRARNAIDAICTQALAGGRGAKVLALGSLRQVRQVARMTGADADTCALIDKAVELLEDALHPPAAVPAGAGAPAAAAPPEGNEK